jgi:hypothetical protein
MYMYILVCQLLQLLHTATASVRQPSDPSSVSSGGGQTTTSGRSQEDLRDPGD